jgi:glucose-6-phosphate isomerase
MSSLKDLIEQAGTLSECPSWGRLKSHAKKVSRLAQRELLDEPGRFDRFSRGTGDLFFDYSRNRLTTESVELLLGLARERQLETWIELMFTGAAVNNTENRPALHTALRRPLDQPLIVDGTDMMPIVRSERNRVLEFAEAVREGRYTGSTGSRITDIVNIGIGGSDLGLVMVAEALRPYRDAAVQMHFVSNIDGAQLADVLEIVNPESTLFIICSKSFTTLETRLNADAARQWLVDHSSVESVDRHFAAISVNDAAMDEFGISQNLRFRIWDWVGGRYSLWSSVGLSLAIGLGAENFKALLAGAAEMDRHFRTAALEDNLPVLLAMVGIWNQNFLGATSHAVLPYDSRLCYFPAFLQQLEMESNGKGVSRAGGAVDYPTGGVIWGEPGSNAQHSFFQLLHQGTVNASMDFIASANASSKSVDQHQHGLANMLAQAEAFARGRDVTEIRADLLAAGYSDEDAARLSPHKVHPGNRSSNIVLLKRLDPAGLGSLIALYEHKVFVQSVIWGINPFDQWGVELGKVLAIQMTDALSGGDRPAGEAADLPGIGRLIRDWRAR